MKIVKLEGYNHIFAVDVIKKEFQDLFGKSRREYIKCAQKMEIGLHLLDQQGIEQVLQLQQFEKLTNTDLYSLRYVGKLNTRIILAALQDDNIILLTAFLEKGKPDYERAVARATGRLKEIGAKNED